MIQWYREGRFPVDMLTTYYKVSYKFTPTSAVVANKVYTKVDDFEQALERFHNGSVIKPVLLW